MTYEEAIEYLGNHYLDYIPFFQENREQIDKHNKAMDMAIECIDKQIPKKPKTVDDGWRYWDCPTCGARVGSNMDFKYWTCLCGQRLDWNEVE